jgi:hypothetical protein
MKHLLPFVTGFVTFMVISSGYYVGLTEMPTGVCFSAEPNMAMMLLANIMFVALTCYVIQLGGNYTAASGAKHGAFVALTANGFLNLLFLAMFTCFTTAQVVQDILVNIPMMAATGAAVAFMYARGEAKTAAVA